MKLTWQPITLDLKTTFRIAHGASDHRYNVITTIESGDLSGQGEAAAVPYHGESQAGIMNYLAELVDSPGSIEHLEDPFWLEQILSYLPAGSQAARASIDIALHDLWGKSLGQPLYRLFGLNPNQIPETCFTIAIDEPEIMAARAGELNFSIIKIKLGTENDEKIVAAIRQVTSARIRLDANAAWSREIALKLIPRLAEYDIEFIEQPLKAGDIEGFHWLKKHKLGVPIFADESIKTARDVAAHNGAVDGIVIKLMKSGGIREALKAISTARALDMQIMLGCMVESSLGVTAAAHLAPLCDYLDLDGPLLIKNDPFQGIMYDNGKITLSDRPGVGILLKTG